MADLFISYAREDKARADALAERLRAMGLDVFWDNEIPPGRTWADFIESKLRACKVMLVLWSGASVGSQWVREEARIGRDAGKLIPVLLDGAQPPFGFGEVQTADLTGWHGEEDHPGWKRLVNAIRSFTGESAIPQQSPQQPPQQPWTPPPFQPTPKAQPEPAQPQYGWQAQPQQQQGAAAFAGAAMAGGGEGKLSPMGYIQKCLRLYVTGSGRARRAEFWWFSLFFLVLYVVGYVIDGILFGTNYDGSLALPAVSGLASLALVAPTFAVTARRLHDSGLNGWIAIAAIIPVAGIVIGLIPPNAGANQYGPDPR
jgi:uncharacterized membrane protein YhaH (DUF805 family)